MWNFRTLDVWDEAVWRRAEPLYVEAFPPDTSKKPGLIRSMMERRLSSLHVLETDGDTAGMAVSGKLPELNALLIDYIAVKDGLRGKGAGSAFLQFIEAWAGEERQLQGVVIEAEADKTVPNDRRIRFWQKNGYTLTSYIHHYIWVPEPYRALFKKLRPDARLPGDGESLFRAITSFHKKAYRG